tara:strand:+ start:134 stop:343 length:210 start_codon:yes stop_codon:yes gene_type:complete
LNKVRDAVIRYGDEFGNVDDVLIFGLAEDEDTVNRYVSLVNDAINRKTRIDRDFIAQKIDISVPEDADI